MTLYDNVIHNQKKEKVRVNARIPQSLYDWVCSEYDNTSQAINEGLENLRKSKAEECHTDDIQGDTHEPQSVIHEHTAEINELFYELKRALETLEVAEKNYETQQARIEDLKTQIQELYDQLHTKDGQIEKLNENMHKQAVHIQTLIQENSRLNIKLLPENAQIKKSWWKIW